MYRGVNVVEQSMYDIEQLNNSKYQYELYFQPLLDVKSDRILGAEVLSRGIDADGNIVNPIIFLDELYKSGENAVINFDKLILSKLINLVKSEYDWISKHNLIFTYNVTSTSLKRDNYGSTTSKLLSGHNLSESIIVEIPEEMGASELTKCAYQILELRNNGINVALDDYGKTYSSEKLINLLRFDIIKLDKQYLDELHLDTEVNALNNIIYYIHHLGAKVVAEGVENKKQFSLLRNLGCDILQGYYISKPKTYVDFKKFYNDYSNQGVQL